MNRDVGVSLIAGHDEHYVRRSGERGAASEGREQSLHELTYWTEGTDRLPQRRVPLVPKFAATASIYRANGTAEA